MIWNIFFGVFTNINANRKCCFLHFEPLSINVHLKTEFPLAKAERTGVNYETGEIFYWEKLGKQLPQKLLETRRTSENFLKYVLGFYVSI